MSHQEPNSYRGRHVHVKAGKPVNMYALPNGHESTAVRAAIKPGEEVELVGGPRENKFVEILYWPEGRQPERGFVDSRSLEMPHIDVAPVVAAKKAVKQAAAPEEKPHTVS
jgi:hypothetical protein